METKYKIFDSSYGLWVDVKTYYFHLPYQAKEPCT